MGLESWGSSKARATKADGLWVVHRRFSKSYRLDPLANTTHCHFVGVVPDEKHAFLDGALVSAIPVARDPFIKGVWEP